MQRAALGVALTMALAQPLLAQPSLQHFYRDDAGIIDCVGQAALRVTHDWGNRVYGT